MKILLAAAALLALTNSSLADSRSDWKGYDWHSVDLVACADLGAADPCHILHVKWDWKRRQWVDLWIQRRGSEIVVKQTLINNDRADDDHVCTVVLFQDAVLNNLAAHRFNEHSEPNSIKTATVRLAVSSEKAGLVRSILVGTKQCRKGPLVSGISARGTELGLRFKESSGLV